LSYRGKEQDTYSPGKIILPHLSALDKSGRAQESVSV